MGWAHGEGGRARMSGERNNAASPRHVRITCVQLRSAPNRAAGRARRSENARRAGPEGPPSPKAGSPQHGAAGREGWRWAVPPRRASGAVRPKAALLKGCYEERERIEDGLYAQPEKQRNKNANKRIGCPSRDGRVGELWGRDRAAGEGVGRGVLTMGPRRAAAFHGRGTAASGARRAARRAEPRTAMDGWMDGGGVGVCRGDGGSGELCLPAASRLNT